MIKANDLFPLLQKLMSEDKTYSVELNVDIEEMYNNIYDVIDTDFMKCIEKIGYPKKYKIIDDLKDILLGYKLLLQFPELRRKNVVCMYGFPKDTVKVLQAYGLFNEKSFFGLSLQWIPNDIPIVFTVRSGNWNCLNIPDVEMEISNEEHKLAKNLVNRGVKTKSLLSMLSIPLPVGNNHLAISTITDSAEMTPYAREISNLSDTVVLDNSSVNSFLTAVQSGAFKYLKKYIALQM